MVAVVTWLWTNPWLALGGPFLSTFSQMDRASISNIVCSFQSGQVFAGWRTLTIKLTNEWVWLGL